MDIRLSETIREHSPYKVGMTLIIKVISTEQLVDFAHQLDSRLQFPHFTLSTYHKDHIYTPSARIPNILS
jgi:hypothetical protein